MQKKASAITYISWTLYIVGTVLVFGSYVRLVPTGVAWGGWVLGMIGWGLGKVDRK